MLFVTLQHWIKPVKTIKHLPGPADRIKSKRGNHLCFGHMKNIQHLAKSNKGENKHKRVSNQSKENKMP
jgi:hypothetical protein